MTALQNPTAHDVATARTTTGPLSVPWSQALPLAVVTAFGSGFWIIAMRGAVGAIERTSAPFESWLRESALLVPAYLAAVLVVFAVAARRYGPESLGFRRTVVVIALVAAAATVAGTLLMAGSSVLDYRFQVQALDHMSAAHPGCDAACLAARKDATRDLLVESVGLGAVLMAATNLVLVSLLVAFRGGRLVLTGPREPRELRTPPLRLVLAASLVGAAAIHAAVLPAHLEEWWAAGAFFLVLTVAELAAGVAAVTARRRLLTPSLLTALVVSIVPLVVWWVSRTSGLPFGPEAGEPEPIGVADVMACLLEQVALAAALGLLLARREQPRRWTPYRLAIGLVAVVAVTAIGVGASGIPGFDSLTGGGHSHDVGEGT